MQVIVSSINRVFESMKCPFCQHAELKVTDSRNSAENNAIRRRRECLACNKRFTTFEVVEAINPPLQVRKRDGSLQAYDQQKLIIGLEAACRHTKVKRDDVIALAGSLTDELVNRQETEVDSALIGEKVMRALEALDRLAYIRYACVYRRFKNISELRKAIELME